MEGTIRDYRVLDESIRVGSPKLPYRADPEEYEDLLIRYSKKKPEIEYTREPAKVQGAEVEELD